MIRAMMGGFPQWTLWGMGLAAGLALLAIGLALLGQSPKSLRRSGLDALRLDMRVRALTGWGFALLLLAIGFFLAGVPLGPMPDAVTTPAPIAGLQPTTTRTDEAVDLVPSATPTATPANLSGAFVPPPGDDNDTSPGDEGEGPLPTSPAADVTPAGPDTEASPLPTAAAVIPPTATATASATPTMTPTATATPSPTYTPTPVEGDLAQIDTDGSTRWVRRSPGGAELVVVRDGDLVLLRAGRANQRGILWQEIVTLDGVIGWVEADILAEL